MSPAWPTFGGCAVLDISRRYRKKAPIAGSRTARTSVASLVISLVVSNTARPRHNVGSVEGPHMKGVHCRSHGAERLERQADHDEADDSRNRLEGCLNKHEGQCRPIQRSDHAAGDANGWRAPVVAIDD